MVVEKILGYKVKTIPDKKMGGYEGQNYYAAKLMHFSPKITDKKQVDISTHYTGEKRREIIKHEIHEAELMRLGHPYMYSHKHANHCEHKPFNKILERRKK